MARDPWGESVRKYAPPKDDEPQTVARVVRRAGHAVSPEQVAREQEEKRRREREEYERNPRMRTTFSRSADGETVERVEKLAHADSKDGAKWVTVPVAGIDRQDQSQGGSLGQTTRRY